MASVEDLLRSSTLYRNLSAEDQKRLAAVSLARSYEKGQTIFAEGDQPAFLFTIAGGRVKVVKTIPSGKEIILEIFGARRPRGRRRGLRGQALPASASRSSTSSASSSAAPSSSRSSSGTRPSCAAS